MYYLRVRYVQKNMLSIHQRVITACFTLFWTDRGLLWWTVQWQASVTLIPEIVLFMAIKYTFTNRPPTVCFYMLLFQLNKSTYRCLWYTLKSICHILHWVWKHNSCTSYTMVKSDNSEITCFLNIVYLWFCY